MILKAILRVQHFCSFGEKMLFIVNLLIKTDSTVISVPCMLESKRSTRKPSTNNPTICLEKDLKIDRTWDRLKQHIPPDQAAYQPG